MKRIAVKTLLLLLSLTITHTTNASMISFDLLTENAEPFISYSNPYHDIFTSSSDGFQIYQRGIDNTIASALLDDSSTATSDNLGLIDSHNQQNFFGIVDTVNPDNPTDFATASWLIDISNLTMLTFLIDMAAMGDFEASDQFWWRYSIDNAPLETIFQGVTDESAANNYILESGTEISLFDPIAVNSTLLNNKFQHFSSTLAGSGNVLKLELTAKTNSGSEVIAFQNVQLQGKAQSISVNEPASLPILLLALILFFKRSWW